MIKRKDGSNYTSGLNKIKKQSIVFPVVFKTETIQIKQIIKIIKKTKNKQLITINKNKINIKSKISIKNKNYSKFLSYANYKTNNSQKEIRIAIVGCDLMRMDFWTEENIEINGIIFPTKNPDGTPILDFNKWKIMESIETTYGKIYKCIIC